MLYFVMKVKSNVKSQDFQVFDLYGVLLQNKSLFFVFSENCIKIWNLKIYRKKFCKSDKIF